MDIIIRDGTSPRQTELKVGNLEPGLLARGGGGGGYMSDKVCDFVAKSSTYSISRDFLAVAIAALARGWLHV